MGKCGDSTEKGIMCDQKPNAKVYKQISWRRFRINYDLHWRQRQRRRKIEKSSFWRLDYAIFRQHVYNLIFMTSKRPVKCVHYVHGVQLCVHYTLSTCTYAQTHTHTARIFAQYHHSHTPKRICLLVVLLTMCLLAKIVNICLYCQERSSTFKIQQKQLQQQQQCSLQDNFQSIRERMKLNVKCIFAIAVLKMSKRVYIVYMFYVCVCSMYHFNCRIKMK